MCTPEIPILPAHVEIVNASYSSLLHLSVPLGQALWLDCQRGYTHGAQGPVEVARCGPNNRLIVGRSFIRCHPVTCGNLPTPLNSFYDAFKFTFGAVSHFRCRAGFVQTGGGSAMQCGADGTWEGTPIVCSGKGNTPAERLLYPAPLLLLLGLLETPSLLYITLLTCSRLEVLRCNHNNHYFSLHPLQREKKLMFHL